MVELKSVSKNYFEGNTKHSVLNNFELYIPEGEIIILFGKSGSGKSTLLNIISGIDDQENKINTILTEVGLLDRADTYPDKLSGGEQQRISIARALIHNPDIILADEPTGNLDYETSLQIIDLLDRVVKKKGKTMIMVTHSKDVIGLADRIISLKEGKITEMQKESLIE